MSKPTPLSVQPGSIPSELKAIPRWLLWKLEQSTKNDGEVVWKKIPYRTNGRLADVTNQKHWSTFDDVIDNYLMGEYDGIGIAFDGSDDIHGIDLDKCVDENGELSGFAKEFVQKIDGYVEISPSGTGIKAFIKSNLAISGKRGNVEVYREGRYFTVTGRPLDSKEAMSSSKQDISWFVQRHFGENQALDALSLYKPPLPDWNLARVREELIQHVGSIESYDEWLNLGMMLHHQGQGDEHWMELWDELSRQTGSYDRDELVRKWDSFSEQRNRGGGALTIATLIKRAVEAKAKQSRAKFDEYKEQIEVCDDYSFLMGTLCPEIKADDTLDRINRNILANLLKVKFKKLDTPLSIGEVRQLIRPKLTGDVPMWLDGWVYVTHEDRYFNVATKRKVTVAGFNAMHNREVGAMETDMSASVLALDMFKIPTPDKIIYLPSAPEIFDLNGTPCVNAYDHNSPPDVPAELSRGDKAAIERVLNHLRMILVEPGAVDIMVSWMAHNVQKPGTKIRWAPLIKGIEGDGKSVIGKLMSYVMGQVNVGHVSATTLADGKYTGWADGKCVNVLEEIRMVGHNRHDMLNAVKPYITNDIVTVHPKHVNEYVAPNTVNYIAFTNHQDALPLEETDRRWWVQFTPFTCQEDLKAATSSTYYDELNKAIENHYSGLRKWLLDWSIPESFKPNGQAPASSAKEKMIALNVSDDEIIVRDLIEQGAPGVHRDVISTSHLTNALRFVEDVEPPKTFGLARVLTKLGYSKVVQQIKWRGVRIRAWSKGTHLASLSEPEFNAEVRRLLDSTLVDDILE